MQRDLADIGGEDGRGHIWNKHSGAEARAPFLTLAAPIAP